MAGEERLLKLLLRIIGTVALFAIIAVVMPYSWMNAIHKWLGMGELPAEPIVGYLAPSTSGFYAMLGGLFWLVSFDLNRHRIVLCYLRAYPNNRIVMRPSEKSEAKAAGQKGSEAWFCHVENVFGRQRRHRALQPAAIERVIWIGS